MRFSLLAITAAAASLASCQAGGAGSSLDPVQPVQLPDGAMSSNPLSHLGGNGPWTIAPNVNNISSDIPAGCAVDQAAYVLRHGSRFPDTGAHNSWVEVARRFREQNFTATGPMSFIHGWDTPLTHPDIQIAQLSKTGYKEMFDMGYTLRTRYPDLYEEGQPFLVWANNYTRVIQTAQLFLQGFLGTNASLGQIASISGRGFPAHLGDTLAPSDMCPAFVDDSSQQTSAWRSSWLPDFVERLSQFVEGDLTLEDGMWNDFPYICGFESQIVGRMSPFCDTFTQQELDAYEYQQDLRYYYGVGPGAHVASKMMVPFLKALMDRFDDGPVAEGTGADGASMFTLPKLLMSFLNDGQLNQLAAAVGIFDAQPPLPTDHIPERRLWRSSRISPMRGTIAFERLSCQSDGTSAADETRVFVRILVNEAVYPVPHCQEGPGKSCPLKAYLQYIDEKLEQNGSFRDICNSTDPAAPSKVLGASFFTNLAQDHVEIVS